MISKNIQERKKMFLTKIISFTFDLMVKSMKENQM